MKRLITFALMATCLVISCSKFDDSAIWDKLNDHENRIAYLEEVCKKMNKDIVNLQTLVTALETNDYIVNASPLATGDGYTFIFKSGKSVVIYNGKDGKDGVDGKDGFDGKDGVTPTISVMKDVDGVYYWTVNGEWLLVNGQKVKASATDGKDGENGNNGKDGITPKFKIEDEYWFVSYDNGQSWEKLGKATNVSGSSNIQDVIINDKSVSVILSDGTIITVLKSGGIDMLLTKASPLHVIFSGQVNPSSPDFEVGVFYSTDKNVLTNTSAKVGTYHFDENGNYQIVVDKLDWKLTYYYRTYVYSNGSYSYGDVLSFTTSDVLPIDLAPNGASANCYMVSTQGTYGFPAVKGNSKANVGTIDSVEVLWESFGTMEKPQIGDLINSVSYLGNTIVFQTNYTLREGNALIAAKDIDGNILWSWHIWIMKENIVEQTYANEAGIMMDRNLGAFSATPGSNGCFGLIYQWGRKDPFLGAAEPYENAVATIDMPEPARSTGGSLAMSIANPTTIIYNENGSWTSNTIMWQESKTIYDPCPYGWKVPEKNVWANAKMTESSSYNDELKGCLFYNNNTLVWYPYYSIRYNRGNTYGSIQSNYWSSKYSTSGKAYLFRINSSGPDPAGEQYCSMPASVRCMKE